MDCCNQLKTDSEQYIDYASDVEERTIVVNAKNGLDTLAKTSSVKQIDSINKDIERLEKYA